MPFIVMTFNTSSDTTLKRHSMSVSEFLRDLIFLEGHYYSKSHSIVYIQYTRCIRNTPLHHIEIAFNAVGIITSENIPRDWILPLEKREGLECIVFGFCVDDEGRKVKCFDH